MGQACVFCGIVNREEPAELIYEWNDALAFKPLNPVTEGHILVIPKMHVEDFTMMPEVSAAVMGRAAQLAKNPCNIITSVGEAATQTIFHLHAHIIPRRAGDGLRLPWS